MVNTIQPKCTYKDCHFYGRCLEDNILMRICAEDGMHNEDYYWLTGEVETLEQFRQDLTDDGLWEKPLWTMGDEPQGKLRKFGEGSTAGHLDEVNL